MLGKLATYLRMCGYDAAYALDRGIEDDDAIRALTENEDRTLLTRDAQLAEQADDSLLLTERDIEDQLRELRAAGVDLSLPDKPQRCSACNGEVVSAGEVELGELSDGAEVDIDGDIDADVPEHVPDDAEPYRCRDCGQWFWKGSHWDDVRETLAAL
ncbi:Mut7-C RNAse domain-containing protein [Halolamina salifodinae]|nr:Mut7-C RNAse domain-containing protein [Halolamina salifodinae]